METREKKGSESHLAILMQGVEVWNTWREENKNITPYLWRAYLIQAQLNGVNLKGGDLRGVYLTGASLSGADLSNANLVGSELQGANLNGADLSESDLREANLSEANLSGAYLNRADLSDINLSGIDLSEANLSGANLSGTKLIGTNLNGTKLIGANLGEANLSGADLSNANLIGSELQGANLRGVDLSGSDLSGTNLSSAKLGETIFLNVDLSETTGLDTCVHFTQSIIDNRTLNRSKFISNKFLDDIGFPQWIATNTNMEPAGFIALVAAAMQGIQTWIAIRDKKKTEEVINETYTKMLALPAVKEEANDVIKLIPEEVLQLIMERIDRCWFMFKDVLAGNYMAKEVDDAKGALMGCICRNLRLIDDLEGLPSEGYLREMWKRYCLDESK